MHSDASLIAVRKSNEKHLFELLDAVINTGYSVRSMFLSSLYGHLKTGSPHD